MIAVVRYGLVSLIAWSAVADRSMAAAETPMPVRIVERSYVQLSDLVDLSAIAPDISSESLSDLSKTPILPLHPNQMTTYGTDEIREAVTRRIPGMIDYLYVLPEQAMTFSFEKALPDSLQKCLVLKTALDAGEPIRQDRVAESTSCDSTISRELLSLGDGAVMTRSPLPRGAKLPISTISLLPAHVRGDALTLMSKVGPVTVSRPVEVVHSTFANGAMLVRTANGKVLSAVFEPSATSTLSEEKP